MGSPGIQRGRSKGLAIDLKKKQKIFIHLIIVIIIIIIKNPTHHPVMNINQYLNKMQLVTISQLTCLD